jgi:dihydroxyacetone kinase-like protein
MNSVCAGTRRLKPRVKITSATVDAWMRHFDAAIRGGEPLLTDLDRAIGDGDHGVNMRRGMQAVVAALDDFASLGLSGRLRTVSRSLTSSVGGASGPLYGAFFLQAAQAAAGRDELSLAELALLVEAGCQGVVQLGKASVGDKTMVDTLQAAVGALKLACQRRESLDETMAGCVAATRRAADGTIPMQARKGRASYLGERSIGFEDPGAASAHLLFAALAQALDFAGSPAPSSPFNPPMVL